jgi:hypothetical protein
MTVSICIGYVRVASAATWREAMAALRADITGSRSRMTLIRNPLAEQRDMEELAAVDRGPDEGGYLVTSGSWAWMDTQRWARAGEHGLTGGSLALVHDYSNGNRYEWTIDVLCKIIAVDGPAHKATVRITQHDSAQFTRGDVVTLPASFLRPRKPAPVPAGEWHPRVPDGTRITAEEFTPLIDAAELTEDEQAGFSYLDWAAIGRGEDSASFFRRQGQLYDLGEFSDPPPGAKARGWNGFSADTFFSGVLVRFIDPDTIQAGLLLG